MDNAYIEFIKPTIDKYISTFDKHYNPNVKRVMINPCDSLGISIAKKLIEKYKIEVLTKCNNADWYIFTQTNQLQKFLNKPAKIIAPVSNHYDKPIFIVTIPKAGTHLLYELLHHMGYGVGGEYKGEILPKHWYFPFGSNSHVTANHFLTTLSHFDKGGANHPFFSSPVLFVYRNPMDIVVSETYYYIKKDKTPLAHFYSTYSDEERCLNFIQGDPIIGSIRDRVVPYLPWMRFDNIIPISFEELIGAKGNGTDIEQYKTIWSLQLKLHVSGSPKTIGDSIFNTNSPTFRQGKINCHKQLFRPEHYQAFLSLPQDFMTMIGYDMHDDFQNGHLPEFVNKFRHHPTIFS